MTKLHYRKVEHCSSCVYHYIDNLDNFSRRCVMVGQQIETGPDEFPDWCPHVDYEEKIEVNESESVWVKIKGK